MKNSRNKILIACVSGCCAGLLVYGTHQSLKHENCIIWIPDSPSVSQDGATAKFLKTG